MKNWWKALAGWWERQRPFRRSNVDLWHRERQVMPNGPISPNNHAVTGNHRAVETSDDFPSNVDPMWMHERPVTEDLAASTYKFAGTTDTMPDGSLPEGADSIDWYHLQPPPNPIAKRRARAEELLNKLLL